MANDSLSGLYALGNKNNGLGSYTNLSLGFSLALFDGGLDPTDATSEYSNYAMQNDWVTAPYSGLSLSAAQTTQGGVASFNGEFKFNPLLPLDPGPGCYYGLVENYPKSTPVALTSEGTSDANPYFVETSVSSGTDGVRVFGASSYATMESCARGSSYKQPATTNAGDVVTFAVWMKPTIPGAARNWLWNDMDAVNDFNPYRGIGCNIQTSGQIRWQRGDGGGTLSSDRYTFGTTATLPSDQWAFIVVQTANNTNTVSTSYNYCWAYIYNARTSSWGWTNGASYISGTGGIMSYSSDSGTNTTQCMIFNPAGSASAGLVWELGHLFFYNQAIGNTTNVEYLREQTDIYTA